MPASTVNCPNFAPVLKFGSLYLNIASTYDRSKGIKKSVSALYNRYHVKKCSIYKDQYLLSMHLVKPHHKLKGK